MSNETEQEVWNATHAQLLKNVAEAQGKLLAALNERNDLLVSAIDHIRVSLNKLDDVVIPVLGSLENRLMEAHNNRASLVGRLDGIRDEIRVMRKDQQEKYERLLILIGICAPKKVKKRGK
jgi:hypothetical protein